MQLASLNCQSTLQKSSQVYSSHKIS